MECIITYQKANGEIMYRPREGDYDRTIGQETAMGWIVLDIHYLYKGNYYRYNDYMRLIRKEIQKKEPLKKRIIRSIIHILRKLEQ